MFKPIKLMDYELSKPFPTIADLDGYGFVQFLVRLHGTPIGYLRIPVINKKCSALATCKAVLKQYSWRIIRLMLLQELKLGKFKETIEFKKLLKTNQLGSPVNSIPLVSVVLCTRDRSEELPLCLDSLEKIDYPNLDILVIDNAPNSDDTQKLVTECYRHMRYFREPRPGLDFARNRAILEAQGEIVAFTDDDVIVDPGWITELVKVFIENPEVMAVTGMVVPSELETEEQDFFEMYGGFNRGFHRQWFRANSRNGKTIAAKYAGTGRIGTGANMSFRRNLFHKIGYFDPALDAGTITKNGGDIEIFFRILKEGFTIGYEPNAVVRHRHRRDRESLLQQMLAWGIGVSAYLFSSFMRYPDERSSLTKFYLWWIYQRLRNLIALNLRQSRLRNLAWAELKGLFMGPWRYHKACIIAKELEEKYGVIDYKEEKRKLSRRNPSTAQNRNTAVRVLDIAEPIQEISGVSNYDKVRVYVNCEDFTIGCFDIPTLGQSISVTRILDSMVDKLGNKLISKYDEMHISTLWSEANLALAQHLSDSKDSKKVDNFQQLPDHQTVSIIVATYDRPKDLKNCLSSLMDLKSTRNKEIIVVDNNPSSGLTSPVVESFPGVILVKEMRKGVSYARNEGISKSTGDIVVSIDDDVTVPPEWLERLIAQFIRDDVMVVTGNVLPIELDTRAQNLYEIYGGLGRGVDGWEANRVWFENFTRGVVPTWLFGGTANLACRAYIFGNPKIGMLDEALGPGSPTGVGEDTYLFYKVLKAGYTIVYEPKAYVFHRHRNTMSELRRQIYNYSKGFIAYNLTTLIKDFDLRTLSNMFFYLPKYHLKRCISRLRGRYQYPLSMILIEIAGNLAGPWGLWRSRRRVKRLGSSQPYISISDRTSNS